jgi:hypothetical protein
MPNTMICGVRRSAGHRIQIGEHWNGIPIVANEHQDAGMFRLIATRRLILQQPIGSNESCNRSRFGTEAHGWRRKKACFPVFVNLAHEMQCRRECNCGKRCPAILPIEKLKRPE